MNDKLFFGQKLLKSFSLVKNINSLQLITVPELQRNTKDTGQ